MTREWEQVEHTRWVKAMTEHFAKMVRGVTSNAHPDDQQRLMATFIDGLESHFSQKYKAKYR